AGTLAKGKRAVKNASNPTVQVTYDLIPLSDEQLVGLSLADLRGYLWGLPWEEAKQLKERRRKLKNRKNSANWRKRHLDQWGKLEEQNTLLKWEVQKLAQENALLRLQLKALQDQSKPLHLVAPRTLIPYLAHVAHGLAHVRKGGIIASGVWQQCGIGVPQNFNHGSTIL
uniref:Basic leucine zipper domain-containing protein n=1 Tax=Gopherus evgoodei TaxID=1825980 RepID=A0A8C4WDM1_9SAUR